MINSKTGEIKLVEKGRMKSTTWQSNFFIHSCNVIAVTLQMNFFSEKSFQKNREKSL